MTADEPVVTLDHHGRFGSMAGMLPRRRATGQTTTGLLEKGLNVAGHRLDTVTKDTERQDGGL